MFSKLLKYLGLLKNSPSDVIAKFLIPKSIPIELLFLGSFSISISQHTVIKYLPVDVRLIVTFSILPSISFDFANLTHFNLGNLIFYL